MPLYYINGNICRLATASDIKAEAPPPAQPKINGEKPKWIVVTGPSNASNATVGKAYRVTKWEMNAPWFKGDDGASEWGRWPGHQPTSDNPGWAPAPSPAPRTRTARKGRGGRRG